MSVVLALCDVVELSMVHWCEFHETFDDFWNDTLRMFSKSSLPINFASLAQDSLQVGDLLKEPLRHCFLINTQKLLLQNRFVIMTNDLLNGLASWVSSFISNPK